MALQRLPAILNFSGGRSSAFMLYHILDHRRKAGTLVVMPKSGTSARRH